MNNVLMMDEKTKVAHYSYCNNLKICFYGNMIFTVFGEVDLLIDATGLVVAVLPTDSSMTISIFFVSL